MALFFADLVREYSFSAGAGDFVLAGAVAGHRRFAEAVPAGARFHYAIAGVAQPEEWETGEGEIGSGGVLVRFPLASSAGRSAETGQAALVAFPAGLKTVTLTVAAEWFARQEAAALAGVTPFGRSLIDDADAAAARATLGLGQAAVKATGTSGDAVPVLNGGAASWAAGARFGGTLSAPLVEADSAAGEHSFLRVRVNGADRGHYAANAVTGDMYLAAYGGTIFVEPVLGALVGTWTAAGLDVAGLVRCDALRIDAAAQAAAGAAATHKLPVSIDGATYYLLLSSS